MFERPAGGRILLVTGHGGRRVVQDDQDMPARRGVVHHFHQAGDAAVDEGAVADDADHATRLLGGQHMAQSESHSEAGPHADAGVHGLER